MTIIEAIKEILKESKSGMTSREIFTLIVDNKLYNFNAQNPIGVVNGLIRRHCIDLSFPTSNPVKYFNISGYSGKKPLYALIDTTHKRPQTYDEINMNHVSTETRDLLPEEKISIALKEHLATVQSQLLDNILNQHPSFFEHLVVDLLLKMGYGYDKEAGIVTGSSHDGGIDGIINEDKLGLDLIYLQAKRYNPKNKVGRKEVQAFVGAMQHIQKGVFITTSTFTNEALDYAKNYQQKSIRLINGRTLCEYMVKYEVGVSPVAAIKLYQIDSDYFSS